MKNGVPVPKSLWKEEWTTMVIPLIELWSENGTIGKKEKLYRWHRTDGPALVYENGKVRWFLNGHWCPTFKEYAKSAMLSDEIMTMLTLKYGDA